MKQFVSPGFRLSRMPFGMKVTYSLFLVFMAAGFGSNFFLQYMKTGFSYQGFVQYYRGNLDEAGEETGEGEAPAGEMVLREPMSVRELLLTTHMHLFIMPVVILILVHVFFMSSVGPALKTAGMILPFAGMFFDLSCPWLIRFAAPQFAALKLFSVAVMAGSRSLVVFAPLIDMWRPFHPEN